MAEDSKYVIQHRVEVADGQNGDGAVAWEDIATVSVPPRTKRKTIIEKAFAEAGVNAPPLLTTWHIRVLDEESAREIPVGAKEQPPKLVIG